MVIDASKDIEKFKAETTRKNQAALVLINNFKHFYEDYFIIRINTTRIIKSFNKKIWTTIL